MSPRSSSAAGPGSGWQGRRSAGSAIATAARSGRVVPRRGRTGGCPGGAPCGRRRRQGPGPATGRRSRRRGEAGRRARQAQQSALEPYLLPSPIGHAGRRVVAGQRLTQGPAESFLCWCQAPRSKRQYYVRQLWDGKGRSDLATLSRRGLTEHSTLCAWALARAHARSGDAAAISGYLGKSDVFDRAVATFAGRYADITESDHQVLAEAIADGTLAAHLG